jgi:hypothetical protein
MLADNLKAEREALRTECEGLTVRLGCLRERIYVIDRIERLEQDAEVKARRDKALYRLRAMMYDRDKMMRMLTEQHPSSLNKLTGNEWRGYLASIFKVTEDGFRYDFYSLPSTDQYLLWKEAQKISKEIKDSRKEQWLATRSAGLDQMDFLGLTVDEWKTRRSEATAG